MAAVGAFGVELGFGAFGACAFGVGEGASGVDLGLVVSLEGVAFAGGVVADTAGFGAGVGFGLAGAADLGFGAAGGLAGGGERVVAFAGVRAASCAGGGDLLGGAGLDGGDLRGGVAAQLGELGGWRRGRRRRLAGRRSRRRRRRRGRR